MARQPTNENGVLTLGHIPLVHTVSAVHLAKGEKLVENILEKKTSLLFQIALCCVLKMNWEIHTNLLDWIEFAVLAIAKCAKGNALVWSGQGRSGIGNSNLWNSSVGAFSKLRFRIPNKQKRLLSENAIS